MPSVIGPFLEGADLVFMTVAPATLNGTTGVWSLGIAVDYTVIIRRLSHQFQVQAKDVRPVTNPNVNMVAYSRGTAIQITTLKLKNNVNPGQPIHNVIATGTHCQVIWSESHEQFNGYFLVGNMDGGIDGNEEQQVTVDLQPVALVAQNQVTRTFV